VRGNPEKAQFPSSLAEIVSEAVRIWRQHHLGYDQTKYVVEQARRRLKLRPLAARRRTVDRLDKSEIERQSFNRSGLMGVEAPSYGGNLPTWFLVYFANSCMAISICPLNIRRAMAFSLVGSSMRAFASSNAQAVSRSFRISETGLMALTVGN
jgi:hypothetical protein